MPVFIYADPLLPPIEKSGEVICRSLSCQRPRNEELTFPTLRRVDCADEILATALGQPFRIRMKAKPAVPEYRLIRRRAFSESTSNILRRTLTYPDISLPVIIESQIGRWDHASVSQLKTR